MNHHPLGCECPICCSWDAMQDNNLIHQAERAEELAARAVLTETQRIQACRHTSRVGSVCPDCADEVMPDEC